MSKIYEALLRAELERAAAANGDSRERVAALAVDHLLRPELQTSYEPQPALIDSPAYLAPEPTFDPVPDSATLAFSLPTTHVWSPRPGMLPALEERGAELEHFRSLRSRILEVNDSKPLKSIVISSGLPGEGKSFVALNTALSFARHKSNRVLLIDGDMRRSSLHALLGAPREPGLSDYLSGRSALSEVLQRPSSEGGTRTMQPGLAALTLLPGGADAEKAGDLTSSPKFGELIRSASAFFDWIFIDSPPVNLVSDAVSLARVSDAVMLVAREGVTSFKTAQKAQTQFKSANLLGFVLNAVRKLPTKSDYYGSYDTYKREA